jgi:hypothetical protein
MNPEINRRTLFKGSLIFAAAGTVVACTEDGATATSAPTAPPTRAPTAAAAAPGTSTRRTVASSFGPNGTHYPTELPWLGQRAATELVADCDWIDIAKKIQGLDAKKVAAGVIIRVRPGTLPGAGAKSSSRAVLTGIGNPSWTKNVVIAPLEGFGSVIIATAGIRIDQCARLSFFGLMGAATVTLTKCVNLQLGWSRFNALSLTRGGREIGLFELVLGFRQNAEDTVGVRPTDTFEMTNLTRQGCVFGPSVKPDGSTAHCDTIQLEGTGSGPFGPITSVDCVDYGSSNAAELLDDGLSLADYRHCLILAGQLPWRIYPLRPGDYPGNPNAFSGGCTDVRLTDSVVAGAVGRMGFTQVQNSTLSYAPAETQQPSVAGSWNVDPDIADWSAEQIMAQQSVRDYEIPTLKALWSW